MRVLCNFHNGALETPHQGMLRLQLKPVYMVGLWTFFTQKVLAMVSRITQRTGQ